MTTDKLIINALKDSTEKSRSLLTALIDLGYQMERITAAIQREDDARASLIFRYDLDDHINGVAGNRIVQRENRFQSNHKPENFQPTELERKSLTSLALAIQRDTHPAGLPGISLDVLQEILGYSFRLGYMKGWEAKRK